MIKLCCRTETDLMVTCVSVLVNHGVDIYILGNQRRNILSITFRMLLMKFLDHTV